MKFTETLTINRPRDAVWRFFDEPANLQRWQPTLRSVEPLMGEQGRPGATRRMIYDENGREITMVETLVRRDPPGRFTAEYDSGMVTNYMDNWLEEAGADATRWVMEADFRFNGIFGKLLGLMVRGAIRKRLREDLQRLKSEAEATA